MLIVAIVRAARAGETASRAAAPAPRAPGSPCLGDSEDTCAYTYSPFRTYGLRLFLDEVFFWTPPRRPGADRGPLTAVVKVAVDDRRLEPVFRGKERVISLVRVKNSSVASPTIVEKNPWKVFKSLYYFNWPCSLWTDRITPRLRSVPSATSNVAKIIVQVNDSAGRGPVAFRRPVLRRPPASLRP
ncbi:hypothetical protein EVAR_7208_1 [Eumeta japonica]|uniref:Uncharacterized protein n=1 Tax=Eumeta variegata TaxID=151549 RepID=A0A4C1T330_EUMVA|nr:hypothetical protein EVAR_7208_1 [Eumeta japonica]